MSLLLTLLCVTSLIKQLCGQQMDKNPILKLVKNLLLTNEYLTEG